MGKILTSVIAAITAAVIVSSCNTSGCLENQNSLPLAGLYDSATGRAVSIDSIDVGGVGAPDDSLLYKAGMKLTEIYLPFRSTQPSTSFFIHYAQKGLDDERLNDTLSFEYTSRPYFASEECGAMFRYNLTRMSHTTHLIDSVKIVDSLITNLAVQQIHIYFRVTQEEPDPEQ